MKISLPYIIQDQRVTEAKQMRENESFDWDLDSEPTNWRSSHQNEVFLDGPVSSRVALLDFNEETGDLEPPIELIGSKNILKYDVGRDPEDRRFQAVSTYAIVMKTLQKFEKEDVLGRQIKWAVKGNQLLVVPRAGHWANAFYERESASLQFFYFTDADGNTIHSSKSFDIVAHETGHAILDGIAPGLYDTVTPESLALHEAIADFTALVMSVGTRHLRAKLLEQTNNTIIGMNAFTWIAEEFGRARGGKNGDPYLRNLDNDKTVSDVDQTDAHDLSQVLSGALFRLLAWMFEERKEKTKTGEYRDRSSGESLGTANRIFRRIVVRALDYLPPGEIAFSDYGRALWASDRISNPKSPEYREFIAEEFVRRGIIDHVDKLNTPVPIKIDLSSLDIEALIDSDWLAYDFANRHLDLLCIPASVNSFTVHERLVTRKTTFRIGAKRHLYEEVIYKVSWEATEPNNIAGLSPERGVTFGTTLSISRQTGEITSLLTTNPDVTGVDQSEHRSQYLAKQLDEGLLDDAAQGGATMRTVDGIMRVTGGGRCLHMASGDGFSLVSDDQSSED